MFKMLENESDKSGLCILLTERAIDRSRNEQRTLANIKWETEWNRTVLDRPHLYTGCFRSKSNYGISRVYFIRRVIEKNIVSLSVLETQLGFWKLHKGFDSRRTLFSLLRHGMLIWLIHNKYLYYSLFARTNYNGVRNFNRYFFKSLRRIKNWRDSHFIKRDGTYPIEAKEIRNWSNFNRMTFVSFVIELPDLTITV